MSQCKQCGQCCRKLILEVPVGDECLMPEFAKKMDPLGRFGTGITHFRMNTKKNHITVGFWSETSAAFTRIGRCYAVDSNQDQRTRNALDTERSHLKWSADECCEWLHKNKVFEHITPSFYPMIVRRDNQWLHPACSIVARDYACKINPHAFLSTLRSFYGYNQWKWIFVKSTPLDWLRAAVLVLKGDKE